VMRAAAGDDPDGVRLRGLIVVQWRAGLRISEALALTESDLDPARGAVLVRRGKGGKRREVGMDRWAWGPTLLLAHDPSSTSGWRSVLCVARPDARSPMLSGWDPCPAARHRGRRWRPATIRTAPAPPRHAVEMSREGVPLVVIQRQLGHADLGITSVYLRESITPRSSTPSTNGQRR